jgi:phage/plasmid-associated DNA primase
MVLDAPTIARVTGEDPVTLRDLHGKAFEFLPKFKCIIYGNEPPKISGSVPALARRTIVIRLHKIFKDAVGEGTNKVEVGLMKILESEFGGILQWMIDGCLQWQKVGLCVPAVVAESSRNFIANADTFARWLAEDVLADPAGRLWNEDAYPAWCAYAVRHGHEPGSNQTFGNRLTDYIGEPEPPGKHPRTGKSARYRAGWRLAAHAAVPAALLGFTEVAEPAGSARPAPTPARRPAAAPVAKPAPTAAPPPPASAAAPVTLPGLRVTWRIPPLPPEAEEAIVAWISKVLH